MNLPDCRPVRFALILSVVLLSTVSIIAQEKATILAGADLTRVVPTGFYFEGQSAPTQMRNAAAVRFGTNRHVIAGLVDTSGYSSEIRAKYEGFLITDSSIRIGGKALDTGAYGFGFTDDGKLNVFDVSGKQILSIAATNDKALRRPRPLMMMNAAGGVRLYSRRSYVVVSAR
ncbi:MAG TPA: hypothetical protein VF721_22870 [Pyrinomonadaceae bacterium]|jgi:hypothetical protein